MRIPAGLLLAAMAASLASCDRRSSALDEAAWWSREGDREEASRRVVQISSRLERLQTAAEDYRKASAAADTTGKTRSRLAAERANLVADIDSFQRRGEMLRHDWMVQARQHSVGKNLAVITSKNGRSYQDVTVSKVTDAGVEFRHKDGTARFSVDDLTTAQLESFGLDEDRATLAYDRERADQAAYSHSIGKALAIQASVPVSAPASVAPSPARTMAATQTTTAAPTYRNPLDEPARPFSSRYSSWSYPYYGYTYRYYTPVYYYPTYSVCPRPAVSCSPAPRTSVGHLVR